MDFYEAVHARRSVRAFRPDPVPDDVMDRLLDAARWAPTGGNMQPWEFWVVRSRRAREGLVATTWQGPDPEGGRPQSWMLGAPVLVVACVNLRRAGARYGRKGFTVAAYFDLGAAIENLLLAVAAEGLGACWVAGFHPDRARAVLGLPEDLEPVALIPLGYPARVARPPYRLPLADIVRRVDD
ncbi:MAG: nitroreductase family protein [Acetobacteraceae bacterium]|nr:nitroreductase family protein [Acetobacteraceae bacterium]